MTRQQESTGDMGLYYTPKGRCEHLIHGPASEEECWRVARARLADMAFAASVMQIDSMSRYRVGKYIKRQKSTETL